MVKEGDWGLPPEYRLLKASTNSWLFLYQLIPVAVPEVTTHVSAMVCPVEGSYKVFGALTANGAENKLADIVIDRGKDYFRYSYLVAVKELGIPVFSHLQTIICDKYKCLQK